MRLIVVSFASLTLAACSGGSSGTASIQGIGAFSPNASLVKLPTYPDGGAIPGGVGIGIANTSPAYTCQFFDAGFPATGTYDGQLQIVLAQGGPITVGTFGVVTADTFYSAGSIAPDGGIAFVELLVPTDPPSHAVSDVRGSVSGTVTLTSVGDDWTGNFNVVLELDAGQNSLTGSFDTTVICRTPE